jgi:hypothetical protein
MKKNWFLNVAGGALLLTVVAVSRPSSAETAACKPACKPACEGVDQASLDGVQLEHAGLFAPDNALTGSGAAACVATCTTSKTTGCAAACATGDVTNCPPIWLLLPRDPMDIFANRIQPLDSKMAVDPARPGNVLVLNGKSFDFDKFRRQMTGPLELVDGSPDAPDSKSVPFTAWLVRNGQPLKTGLSNPDQSILLLNIYEMLKLAKPGDHLQIRPARDSAKGFNFCVSGGC